MNHFLFLYAQLIFNLESYYRFILIYFQSKVVIFQLEAANAILLFLFLRFQNITERLERFRLVLEIFQI
jgi:hypothetical protein